MAILTVAEVLQHVQTDLVDDALQRLIDAADGEILKRLGAQASQTEVLEGGGLYLHLGRKVSAVTSATERYRVEGVGAQDLALAASDYGLLGDGYRVERLTTGANASDRWRGMVTVAYTVDSDLAERKRLLVDLVKLSARYEALASHAIGDLKVQYLEDYQGERERLFRALSSSGRRLVA